MKQTKLNKSEVASFRKYSRSSCYATGKEFWALFFSEGSELRITVKIFYKMSYTNSYNDAVSRFAFLFYMENYLLVLLFLIPHC